MKKLYLLYFISLLSFLLMAELAAAQCPDAVLKANRSGRSDTLICPGKPLNLDGIALNVEGIRWISSGTGIFTPNATSIKTTYVPSDLDILKGHFELGIRSIGNINCEVKDTLFAGYLNMPIVNAGPDQFISISSALKGIQLHGISNEYYWTSSGTGHFLATDISDPVYFPSEEEVQSGNVILKLESLLDNTCGFRDEVKISFVNFPLANIGGSVLQEDKSKVLGATVALFAENNGTYTEIESQLTYTGDFNFTNKPSGNYIIYAIPSDPYNSVYAPTYYGNVIDWTTAKPISISGKNITTASIRLLPFTHMLLNGNDNIAGKVSFTAGSSGVKSSDGDPVVGAIVYLLDDDMRELTYTTTSEDGRFAFSNLQEGKYQLKYEYPGIKSLILYTTVDGDPTTLSSGSVVFERENVITSITAIDENTEMIIVVPNPASESVQINTGISDAFDFTIVNAAGIVELEGKAVNGSEKISVENLNPGIYVIKVVQNNNVFKAKILKK